MNPIEVKIIDPRIGHQFAMPDYATSGSAGIDLIACLNHATTLSPNQTILIPSGIAIYIKEISICAQILPRSGMGHKRGLILGNGVGLIDSDYQGEIKISCWNRSNEPQTINPGDRIAQLVFLPVLTPSFKLVSTFDASKRGQHGFGSTGISSKTHPNETHPS